jgi:menaquinone-dependent protoporphyrinogen IX oxidase
MKNIAVIYKSIYGTTKRYAEWIAGELNASLLEMSTVKSAQLMEYDVVVYGGGLYAGGIAGVKFVAKNPCKSLVVFTVGLATPEITDYSEIITKAFTAECLAKIKIFHLHGGMDYGQLSMAHKVMMALMKKKTEKIPLVERTSDDHALLETYGGKFDFTDKETIKPLVDYVRAL